MIGRPNPLAANVSAALAAVAVALTLVATAAARTDTNGSSAQPSPNCSLYGVVVGIEVLTSEFNSTHLKIDVTKWPVLMTQARAARAAFKQPRLAPALPRYTAFVRHLATVGFDLEHHQRSAAFAELTKAKPDLKAIVGAAKRGHVVCKSGGRVFRIE